MFKNNKTGSFANEKFTENYVEMTPEELEWFDKYGAEGFKLIDDNFTINPDYPNELAQKEREELDKLSLTKREVFLALYKDKRITPEQLKAQITDPEALIEFEYANDYFRGNPLINLIGEKLGYTTDDLDYLFQNGELPAKEEPEELETEEGSETENNVNNSDTNADNSKEDKTENTDGDNISGNEM